MAEEKQMKDIVERLRDHQMGGRRGECEEAADEIERLRAELAARGELVAEMIAIPDDMGTVFIQFLEGKRPPAGTKIYANARGPKDVIDRRHLWEVKHSYYCSESNYYSREDTYEFESFNDYLAEMAPDDFDYNLIFRWDWKAKYDHDTDEELPNDDPAERNMTLQLCIMHQRKGRYVSVLIDVCKNDEPAVIKYLAPRLRYLKDLWAPLNIESDNHVWEIRNE